MSKHARRHVAHETIGGIAPEARQADLGCCPGTEVSYAAFQALPVLPSQRHLALTALTGRRALCNPRVGRNLEKLQCQDAKLCSPLARAVGPSSDIFFVLPICPRPAPALPFFCVRSPLPLSAGLSSCGSSELARSPSCIARYTSKSGTLDTLKKAAAPNPVKRA